MPSVYLATRMLVQISPKACMCFTRTKALVLQINFERKRTMEKIHASIMIYSGRYQSHAKQSVTRTYRIIIPIYA